MPSQIFVSADIIVEKGDKILLIRRGVPPFKGKLALPGGHIDPKDKNIEHTAVRETKEETSLSVKLTHLLNVYSSPDRDPRGYSMAVAFVAKPVKGKPKAASDALSLNWYYPNILRKNMLAFDHYDIITDYLRWKKKR